MGSPTDQTLFGFIINWFVFSPPTEEQKQKTWIPDNSYQRVNSSKSSRSNRTRTPGELPIRPISSQQATHSNTTTTNDETVQDTHLMASNSDSDMDDAEDELNDDFMNEKHESDRNYLNQLKQITQNSELKVEANTDFSLLKNRRPIASRENSFLYSPAPSARNSSAGSKLSNYSTSQRANSAKGHQQRPVIPPADKTMEVVVGKGRRGSVANSARSNANATPTGKRPPQTPKSTGKSAGTGSFACSHCPKRYNNKRDLDIHGMYCT